MKALLVSVGSLCPIYDVLCKRLTILPLVIYSFSVPPRIFYDNEEITFRGNRQQDVIVSFRARLSRYTNVTWWKNGVPLLSETAADIETVETTPPNSTTMLRFNPTRRVDTGEYRLSVEDRFYLIPLNQRHDEVVINIRVVGEYYTLVTNW